MKYLANIIGALAVPFFWLCVSLPGIIIGVWFDDWICIIFGTVNWLIFLHEGGKATAYLKSL